MNLPRLCWLPLVTITLSAAAPTWETLKDLGHWKRLRAEVLKAYQSYPNDPSTIYWMSQVELAFNNKEVAYDLAKKTVALKPGDADFQCGLGMTAIRLVSSVNPIKKLTLSSEGKKACEAALAINPKHVGALQFLAGFYLQAPGFVGGDPKRAAVLCQTLATIDPVQASLFEASMVPEQKDRAKIESLYLKALAAGPKSYRVQSSLAAFYVDPASKRSLEAVKYAQAAIRLEPRQVNGYVALARAYADLEQWKELDMALAEAEKAVPDNLEPYYAAGRILFLKWKDLPRAERYFRKFLTQEPEVGAPGLVHGHWRLGLVLEKLNRKHEAIAELETALRMAPGEATYKQDLQRLK